MNDGETIGASGCTASCGSFDAAHATIIAPWGTMVGKRQIEGLVIAAVPDPARRHRTGVLGTGGKDVATQPEVLRPATRSASGERPCRTRMATPALVHDAVPAPRRRHNVLSLVSSVRKMTAFDVKRCP
ncbi:hypothetical protein FAF44_44690 [Nonomuraea sp. MG754425]|uniref:hypothetical protein n=1 Tax=Nonomuraea sp. MG754425 TaxID=2570319 RepID=UPI001F3CD7D4|nr:hypothetical protein [Nonomuraea sp. MG754425]MCF6475407.1 hypothetical protein [Nonomuraea sp. MG754425]